MSPVSVFLVGGARPNFMKVAPLYRALTASPRFSVTLVHTGQHYEEGLSDVFFKDLDLPQQEKILEAVEHILAGKVMQTSVPKFWDGKAAQRIMQVLERSL